MVSSLHDFSSKSSTSKHKGIRLQFTALIVETDNIQFYWFFTSQHLGLKVVVSLFLHCTEKYEIFFVLSSRISSAPRPALGEKERYFLNLSWTCERRKLRLWSARLRTYGDWLSWREDRIYNCFLSLLSSTISLFLEI